MEVDQVAPIGVDYSFKKSDLSRRGGKLSGIFLRVG